ncbi:hypothetical protein HUG10_20600 (plasmid) [Halorarum halophilum]|uniref:Uncharacterized protein n=1 Tax=Halorarum halophilum TaxID=2743090 RepID=A0A7D5H008_9EURY|nr:hypothetical protein [Halobaculum halophilum]QLG30009.1 hypothetical protein HUG10_20600 [Halobaculum halophilum]
MRLNGIHAEQGPVDEEIDRYHTDQYDTYVVLANGTRVDLAGNNWTELDITEDDDE